MKDQETKDKFVEMRANGMSFSKIAEQLNTCKQTLINWSKEFKHEINNRKVVELEALYEKYYMTKVKQIELFGEKLLSVKDELGKKDFTNMPADKLIELLIKLYNVLKQDKVETIFKYEKDSFSMFDLGKSTTESWEA